MPFSKGSKITWEDVKGIYTNLNKPVEDRSTSGNSKKYGGRTNFGFSNVSVPEKQGQKDTLTDLTLLNNFIKEMSSNSFLKSVATGISLPTKGAKLEPKFLSDLDTQVTNINNTCVFNPFASCFGFNGFSFDGSFGFNGSSFSSNGSSFGSDGSCFGACWGQCFIDNDKMSCFNFSGPTFGGCFGGGFVCNEKGGCCSAADFS